MSLRTFLRGPVNSYNSSTDLGLLVLRVFTGLSLALAHGIGKIPVSEKFIQGVGNLGFPVPVLFAWSAGISELVGGFLLAMGLYTRASALFIAITMATAGFLRHADDPFKIKEKALLYLAVVVLFTLSGPGRYSLDRVIK